MGFDAVRDWVAEQTDGEALLADGYEDALVGVVTRFNGSEGVQTVALYDRDKCIRILVERDGMTWEEAEEFFQFNTEGAYAGQMTPAFATLYPE